MAATAFGETPIGLKSEIMQLAQILQRPFILRIPPFQRPYTWGVKEVSQLIDDLEAAFIREATYYFIGQIVFVKHGLQLDISDGQQRLTTLTMILAYARDRLPQHAALFQTLIIAAANVGRIRLKQGDAEFFAHYVQTPGRMTELAQLEEFANDAQECMAHAAREIVSELAADVFDDARLAAFIHFIAQRAIFNVVDADEPGGAATVFETMNNRGQSLSGADILKGALMSNPGLSEEDVVEGARVWDALEDRAGRENFARLLRYVPALLRTGGIISPGDVAALVDTMSRKVTASKFLKEWLPRHGEAMLELVYASVDAGEDSADVNRRVKCLRLLNGEMWEPLAIDYLARHKTNRGRIVEFFLLYERFMAGCVLGAVETKVRKQRLRRAWEALDDEKALFAAFELTPRMRALLRERVSASSKRDTFRRYLVMRTNGALGEVLDLYEDANVEHVLPARPTAWWRQYFPDPKLYGEYANMLGNYVLVTDKQDQEADNKPYPEKRQAYFNRGYPLRKITADIQPIAEWTMQTLEARHERLVRMLCQDWELVSK